MLLQTMNLLNIKRSILTNCNITNYLVLRLFCFRILQNKYLEELIIPCSEFNIEHRQEAIIGYQIKKNKANLAQLKC